MTSKIDEKVVELQKSLGLDAETMATLAEVELNVVTQGYTLADAIREGSTVTRQARGSWGDGETACALTAASISARARGII